LHSPAQHALRRKLAPQRARHTICISEERAQFAVLHALALHAAIGRCRALAKPRHLLHKDRDLLCVDPRALARGFGLGRGRRCGVGRAAVVLGKLRLAVL
jgi:hypothetical protein